LTRVITSKHIEGGQDSTCKTIKPAINSDFSFQGHPEILEEKIFPYRRGNVVPGKNLINPSLSVSVKSRL
jgi:hypothetical protein